MDNIDLEQDHLRTITHGRQAEAELTLTMTAFDLIRRNALEELVVTDDVALRERLICTCRILDDVREQLQQVALNGQSSALLLEKLRGY